MNSTIPNPHSLWNFHRACTACDLRKECQGPVPGEGYIPCPSGLMIIGEAPGKTEDLGGRPFVGAAGEELETYLWSDLGMRREDVFITNIVTCRPSGTNAKEDWRPKAQYIDICANLWLEPTLLMVKPHVVLAVGGVAAAYFLKGPVVVGEINGIPHPMNRMDNGAGLYRDFTLVPSFHPAAAMRSQQGAGNVMRSIHEAFKVAGKVLKGAWVEVVDNHPNPLYLKLDWMDRESVELLQRTTREAFEKELLALDTETLPNGKLLCMSISSIEGTGLVVMANDMAGVDRVRLLVEGPQVTTIMHNSVYDMGELEQMGIYPSSIEDTMYGLYWKGELIQGLKPQARKILGVQMMDYKDLVHNSQKELALHYLAKVSAMKWKDPDPSTKTVKKKEGGVEFKPHHPQNISKKAKGILRAVNSKDIDPLERWMGIDGGERLVVEREIGPMPIAGLDMVDERKFVKYSARDADITLRLRNTLLRRS